ncbi:MAG: hypothetical protein ABI123_03445 [Ginsengibacter sp.]
METDANHGSRHGSRFRLVVTPTGKGRTSHSEKTIYFLSQSLRTKIK